MSRKELSRAAILAQVKSGVMTLVEATPLLRVCYRQAKRLYGRYRAGGAKSLVHGNLGRKSNRKHPTGERERVVAVIRAQYTGPEARGPGQRFGPTLVAEHLWCDHGILVPRSTLKDWMIAEGLWSRVRKSRQKYVRRERREHFGELVQLDGSFHDWFEGRGERAGKRSCMMSLVDDATSVTLLQFGDQETIWAAAHVLKAWIDKYGVPRALYTDWKNVYKRTPSNTELSCGMRPDEAHTHFGLMCHKLGIEVIGARSPQAKGRIERNHGTQQDRLIKKMRLKGVNEIQAANEYAESIYLAEHNKRFAVDPASSVDYHLPINACFRNFNRNHQEEDVFCLEHSRIIGNDYVVQYKNRGLQLDSRARGRVPAKSRVIVRETESGNLSVIYIESDGRERKCNWTEAVDRAKRTTTSAAQPTTPPPGTCEAPTDPKGTTPLWRPAANHPWRHDIAQDVAVALKLKDLKAHRVPRRAQAALP